MALLDIRRKLPGVLWPDPSLAFAAEYVIFSGEAVVALVEHKKNCTTVYLAFLLL